MKQDTPEWLAWRNEGIGASEAAAILGLSPWKTAHQIWLEKTGRVEPPAPTQAMLRGKELEPLARRYYEAHTGLVMEPGTFEHAEWPVMRCSVDGITLDGECVVEIKCPLSRELPREVPVHYQWQCQHILAVTQAKVLHYYHFTGDEGVLLPVYPVSAEIARLMEAEKAFWTCVVEDRPPPLTDRDVVHRDDGEWRIAAQLYRMAESAVAEQESKKEAARQLLDKLAGSAVRVAGGGITLTRYTREGNVNYRAIPELKGVDLDQYRGKSTQAFRISIEKE